MRMFAVLLLAALGLSLTVGGGYLLTLGGSPFYLLAGLVHLAVGAGLWLRKGWAAPLYAVWLLALLAWSLWEVGLYWWPLATRLGLPVLIGLILTLPASRRRARLDAPFTAGVPVLAVSLLVGAVALAGIPRHLHETEGRLAMDIVNAAPKLGDQALPDGEWHAYGRTGHGQRFSPLSQITPQNVHQLKLIWQVRTGDVRRPDDVSETTYQATPLKVGNTLYLCTPHSLAIALDADTGALRWRFDPRAGMESQRQHQTCRGVSFHDGGIVRGAAETGDAKAGVPMPVQAQAEAQAQPACTQRIFLPTANAKLYALDAHTGKPCEGFGQGGALDLSHNMPFKQPGYYYSTSPPVIAGDRVIVSGAVNDNYAINAPSGVIRAYDVHTGQLLWNWDSGRPDATAPFDPSDPAQTYTASSPNSWSVASVDMALGLAYFPMGNRTPDQLGMYRNADEDKYATSVVALNVADGKVRWVRQFVHHDLWDMDTPAQPVLLDLDLPTGRVPALVIPTKQGDVYVLDRRDGRPIHAVTEQPAPQGAEIPGQKVAPTQPISALSFAPAPLKESSMWGASLVDQMLCRIAFRKLRYEGRYTPPSLQGSLIYPGNFGVFNWGSVAVDPTRQVMFGMPTYLAFVSTLIPRSEMSGQQQINRGEQGINENAGADYAVTLLPFLSPLGVPCQVPPWGTVAAADLRTGRVAYQYRNGTIRDLSPVPVPIRMGVPGIGGPLLTASGLAFLAAAVDDNFRAYEVATGKVLWDVRLPAGGQATPMTYLNSKGQQMVVLVAGGHGSIGTKAGDFVMAFGVDGQKEN